MIAWARKTRGIIRRGTRANQPLATDVLHGTIYYVSDEFVTERSNGTIWEDVSDATAPLAIVTQVITLTGTQHDLSLTANCSVLYCNNASLLTITGIAAGIEGQQVVIISKGAGQVDFLNQNTGSVSANRLINYATVGITSLAAGRGTAIYEYDSVTTKWRLISHTQGAWIVPAYSAGDYTATSGTWTVDAADVVLLKYLLEGDSIFVQWNFDATSISATPWGLKFKIPAGHVSAGRQIGLLQAQNGGAVVLSNCETVAAGDVDIHCYIVPNAGANWAASTHLTRLWGSIRIQVQ